RLLCWPGCSFALAGRPPRDNLCASTGKETPMTARRVPLAMLLLLGIGCGGAEKPAAQAPPPAKAPAPAPAAAKAAAAAAAGAEFGVPECDDYMHKYVACVDSKVPEAGRAAMRQGLEQTKAAWKTAAATPQGKAGLAMGCTQALQAAKQMMSAYGCQ